MMENIRALKELKARRKAEKEQMELQYFTRGVVENGRLYMDIPTDDKKPVETILESVKPIPVKRCKNSEGVEQDVKDWTVKQWFAKVDEELNELKEQVYKGQIRSFLKARITEEAMDTITAITSFLEAMGIDEEKRNEAQRRVNEKNREIMSMETMGCRIEALIKDKGITQRELAERLGVLNGGKKRIIYGGRRPRMRFYKAMAKELNVSLDYLITGKQGD